MTLFFEKLGFEKIAGFLSTEEEVAEARRILTESTEEEFKKLKVAKMNSWHEAQKIILD